MSTELTSLKKLFSAELIDGSDAVFTNGDESAVDKDFTSAKVTKAAFNRVFADIIALATPQERLNKLLSEGR